MTMKKRLNGTNMFASWLAVCNGPVQSLLFDMEETLQQESYFIQICDS